MHANDILSYGHATLMGSLEGLPEPDWLAPGACGAWSIKDIVAHLASYEQMLIDVLKAHAGEAPTPTLDRLLDPDGAFNDDEVARRASLAPAAVLEEYELACAAACERFARLSEDDVRRAGALAWYGEAYDLEDFIVYAFYGHKREHSAQIMAFRSRRGGSVGANGSA